MLTDMIWYIHFYQTNSSLASTPMFCQIWAYVDIAGFVSIVDLTAWAAVERHILIFHQNLISTQLKRFVFHYLPLIIFSIYPLIFFFVVFFILPCDISFDYTTETCSFAFCTATHPILSIWDSWANNIVPVFTIVIFSIALMVRVWFSKYRIGQRFQWRNYRKMTFQLLSISVLYFFLCWPSSILYMAYTFGLPNDIGFDYFLNSFYFTYFIMLLTPFASIISLPELRRKLRHLIRFTRRERHIIVPATIEINRVKDRQCVKGTGTVQ
ncbi:unnamed protein product [Adineta ricciae]|uniref:G-protein coupled receptors family 1 profile domain-containing protein n=1 Tax=Adineta ricciae TaxID=249248 RepID=A0A815ULB5_ADIRI|nr:unnamed protein product [Adineta ricciae]CAF1515430.1 unnamed protein product [Adineta ricciae]